MKVSGKRILPILLLFVTPLWTLEAGCQARRPSVEAQSSTNEAAASGSAPSLESKRRAAGSEPSAEANVSLKTMRWVEDLPREIAQFETVFWDPRDTESLRKLIRETPLVRGKRVLEIGAGTGLIGLCCLQYGARQVVATDINPAAVANAAYNAEHLGFSSQLETRLVSPRQTDAYQALASDERFDVIISNPPWEEGQPTTIEQYAFYDQGFQLLKSLVEGADRHLEPGGQLLLVYGCVEAIQRIEALAPSQGFVVRRRDDRSLDDLPAVFLPGMLLELTRDASG